MNRLKDSSLSVSLFLSPSPSLFFLPFCLSLLSPLQPSFKPSLLGSGWLSHCSSQMQVWMGVHLLQQLQVPVGEALEA